MISRRSFGREIRGCYTFGWLGLIIFFGDFLVFDIRNVGFFIPRRRDINEAL